MKKERTWNLTGAVLGILVIILGVIFIATPARHFYTNSSVDATFGADYYTYQYEATQDAVHNTAVTANNLRELGSKLALYTGVFFMVMGALILLHYGKKLFVVNELPEAPSPAAVSTEPCDQPATME